MCINIDAFVFCSFGMMAPTKLSQLVIQAFYKMFASAEANVLLFFVGQPAGGEYGEQILQLIEDNHLQDRVFITGYQSREAYEKYLLCADAAVQLRQDSRGETSGGLLDCMANGLPTIINAHGSFIDYNDEAVVKFPDPPSVNSVAEAMTQILVDKKYREEKGLKQEMLFLKTTILSMLPFYMLK